MVLDFGRPILLTDLIIPCSGELASVCVDVWLNGEGVDGQRLVVCSDISTVIAVFFLLDPSKSSSRFSSQKSGFGFQPTTGTLPISEGTVMYNCRVLL